MKKLILLGISLALIPITMHADIKIKLTENFLALDGTYKFIMDLKEKIINKVWDVTVKDGKASIDVPKGIKGGKISIKDNVIKIDTKKLAADLEILGETGPFRYTSSTMGQEKNSKNFVVDVGSGLALKFISFEKAQKNKPTYRFVGSPDMPDGSYTLKLIIRHEKDKIYKFDVKDNKIVKVSGDKTGMLEKVAGDETDIRETNLLKIDAETMCKTLMKKHRAAVAGITVGVALPVIIGTAVAGAALIRSSAKTLAAANLKAAEALEKAQFTQYGLTQLTTAGKDISLASKIAEVAAAQFATAAAAETAAARALGGMIAGVATAAAAEAGAVASILTAAENAAKRKAHLGWREATLQIICDSGELKGNAVKIDYEQCRDNELLFFKADQKLIITGSK